ncbi:MAG: amino acid permease [Chloroflexota bacterium]
MTTTTPNTQKRSNVSSSGRFGMFAGVFVPNVLTILGIIQFLRIGWVVGQVGLWGALAIVILANVISFLTGLSLSSISTSMNVRAGGNYYLISRTLGLEIGGAVGIPLFLSQAISIAFYIIGFTEALYTLEAVQAFDPRLISTAVALIFGVISFVGADFALKIQFVILAILIAAIFSFFSGGWGTFQAPLTEAALTDGTSFWVVFAVFFPAVTGIEVGVSMSGDLKKPSQDIPRGTLLSIGVTAFIYILVVIWFAIHLPADVLLTENMAMQSIARWPFLILLGVWASTLSSALGSILAAPRTLQAIALDRVVPKSLAGQMGSPTEPRVAVIISTIIAVAVIWMGDLNIVAPIIAMFFLNTYGMVNLVAGLEKLVGNPSFRPRFNIHWSLSLLGAIGCYGAMFLINATATVFALIITYGIYFFLQRRQLTRTWGDMRSGLLFSLARSILLMLERVDLSAGNWRPNLIVFTGQPHNRTSLVNLAEWLTRGQGIVTFFQLIIGDPDELIYKGYRSTAKKNIKKYIVEHDLQAFAEAEIVSNFAEGALTIAQSHGVGDLEPNAVVMGWSNTHEGRLTQLSVARRLHGLNKSTLILHASPEVGFGKKRKMHIWWQDEEANVDLMLLFGHIILQHRDWHDAEISLVRLVDSEEAKTSMEAYLLDLVDNVRVAAKPLVVTRTHPEEQFRSVVSRASHEADLTIVGMQIHSTEDYEEYATRLAGLVEHAGTVLLVQSASQSDDILTE